MFSERLDVFCRITRLAEPASPYAHTIHLRRSCRHNIRLYHSHHSVQFLCLFKWNVLRCTPHFSHCSHAFTTLSTSLSLSLSATLVCHKRALLFLSGLAKFIRSSTLSGGVQTANKQHWHQHEPAAFWLRMNCVCSKYSDMVDSPGALFVSFFGSPDASICSALLVRACAIVRTPVRYS